MGPKQVMLKLRAIHYFFLGHLDIIRKFIESGIWKMIISRIELEEVYMMSCLGIWGWSRIRVLLAVTGMKTEKHINFKSPLTRSRFQLHSIFYLLRMPLTQNFPPNISQLFGFNNNSILKQKKNLNSYNYKVILVHLSSFQC